MRILGERKHGETFKLMKYVNPVDGFVEWLWNSRDGVTPFGINDARADAPREPDSPILNAVMRHADWHEDAFIPNFIPPVGSRIFSDHTEQSAQEAHQRRMKMIAEKFPYHPLPDASVEKEIIADILRGPRVQVVDEALHAEFRRLAQEDPWRPQARENKQ